MLNFVRGSKLISPPIGVLLKKEDSMSYFSNTLLAYLSLARAHQYVKNLFIFLPVFFGLRITEVDLIRSSFLAFLAYSLVASAVYVFNDLGDVEDDRNHPTKKYRPIASGAVNSQSAIVFMLMLAMSGLGIMYNLSLQAVFILLAYVVLNLAYSLKLKHIAILDVTIIAIGFVMRLLVGAAVTGISLSMWIVIMTFLLALFLALAKRRDDALIYEQTGKLMREASAGYNSRFLDNAMMIMASVVVVAYIQYTVSNEVVQRLGDNLYYTAFFVLLGILRYMQHTFVYESSGSPTKILLEDRFIQLCILGWVATFIWILYL